MQRDEEANEREDALLRTRSEHALASTRLQVGVWCTVANGFLVEHNAHGARMRSRLGRMLWTRWQCTNAKPSLWQRTATDCRYSLSKRNFQSGIASS